MSLIDLLPGYYANSSEVVAMQEGFETLLTTLQTAKIDLFNQMFVSSATWGLVAWEKALGIVTDTSKSYTSRREIIYAKLRGTGTFTKTMLISTVEVFQYCDCIIVEDNANSKFYIKFNNEDRVPDVSVISEMQASVEKLKPAHLDYDVDYTYDYWGHVDGAGTWSSLTTWAAFRAY